MHTRCMVRSIGLKQIAPSRQRDRTFFLRLDLDLESPLFDEDEDIDRSLFVSALTLSSSSSSLDPVSDTTTCFTVAVFDGDAALVEDLDGDEADGTGCGFCGVVALGAASDSLGAGAGALLRGLAGAGFGAVSKPRRSTFFTTGDGSAFLGTCCGDGTGLTTCVWGSVWSGLL